MHQPIYYPYESVVVTQNGNRFGYSLTDIFNQRTSDYTSNPSNAVWSLINANFPNAGAQVSFTGSLTENLNNLEGAGWGFSGWKSSWNNIRQRQLLLAIHVLIW